MIEGPVFKAYETIKSRIYRTPVLTSSSLDSLSGGKLFFKCENFQRTGSFKMRGAAHAMACLSEEQRSKGVVAHSSGNFAQAVALAAKQCGVPAHIVMPNNAPKIKIKGVKAQEGEITFVTPTIEARTEVSMKIVAQTGGTFLHPSNDYNVILGQGTSALELLEDQPDIEAIFTPVGGGGLLAGTALAAISHSKSVRVYAGEPEEVDDAFRSLKSGKIEKNKTANTIADGLRTHLGDINFPIIQQHVSEIVCVSEQEIKAAYALLLERLKILIEPSCAVPFAAILKRPDLVENKKVGIILTGGNVDLNMLPQYLPLGY